MAKGIIYVCSTAVDGLIKIGKTIDFESRMNNLESNGYRNVAGLKRQFAIEVDNYNEIEILLDDLFAKSKVGNTELFSLDINKVIQLLSALQGKQVYPETETKEEVFERVTDIVQTSMLPNGEYTMNVKRKNGKNPKGSLIVENGILILKKGSIISDVSDKASGTIRKISSSLNIKDNVLQEDKTMTSVSIASSVVLGANNNGWFTWKDSLGRVIDVYRQGESEEE